MLGTLVYPLPLDASSILKIDPLVTVGTACACTPQSVGGASIVTVGIFTYPDPGLSTVILFT